MGHREAHGMIDGAFLHCPGVGPVREQKLRQLGIGNWAQALAAGDALPVPARSRAAFLAEIARCQEALQDDDLLYLSKALKYQDHWRILGQHFERASFFDIETTGLGWADVISVIVCYHKGELYTFFEHENLDDFLELLEDVELLVSFNGCSFDVPRVLDYFHVPELPCAHIDLRWLCYHAAWTGGLKTIAENMCIRRPLDLHEADGQEAILLWQRWREDADFAAKTRLARYCAADTLLLKLVSSRALLDKGADVACERPVELWGLLP
jgi:uncharacterized protein YprB with RNaseH-like and TPR domain